MVMEAAMTAGMGARNVTLGVYEGAGGGPRAGAYFDRRYPCPMM
jgi:hypothetical protein